MRAKTTACGVVLTVCGLVAMGAVAQATIIDDFSADSSAKYNTLAFYTNPGASAASYGLNGSGQFAPTPNGSGGATTGWIRNDGYTLNVGDTVSVETCSVGGNIYQTGGLALCPSLTDKTGEREYYVQNRADVNGYGLDGGGVTGYIVTDLDFARGPVVITATRTSATQLDLSFAYRTTSGGTAIVTRSDTSLQAGTYYIGVGGYDASASGIVIDNLSYSSVPEPSTIAMLVTGAIGLLAYAWRRQR